MDAAKVADAVIDQMYGELTNIETAYLRNLIIEEIGKEVVVEACACVKFRQGDRS